MPIPDTPNSWALHSVHNVAVHRMNHVACTSRHSQWWSGRMGGGGWGGKFPHSFTCPSHVHYCAAQCTTTTFYNSAVYRYSACYHTIPVQHSLQCLLLHCREGCLLPVQHWVWCNLWSRTPGLTTNCTEQCSVTELRRFGLQWKLCDISYRHIIILLPHHALHLIQTHSNETLFTTDLFVIYKNKYKNFVAIKTFIFLLNKALKCSELHYKYVLFFFCFREGFKKNVFLSTSCG